MWRRLLFSALITLSGSGSWASQGKPLVYTPHDLFTALNRCWMPPPVELAKQGAEITVRVSFRRDGTVIGQPRVAYFSHGCPNLPRTRTGTRSSKRSNDVSLSISVANSELPSPDAFSFSSSMTTGRRLLALRYESPPAAGGNAFCGAARLPLGQFSAIIRMSSIKRSELGLRWMRTSSDGAKRDADTAAE